jgi:hypothetical protein
MARFFTTHWQFKYWNPETNAEGENAASSGSNQYLKRGIAKGDYVYVVSLSRGHLYLGGRIVVDEITDRATAVQRLNRTGLYDASDWIIGRKEAGTPLNFRRQLSADVSKRLRFLSPDGSIKPLFFVSQNDLDVQATRGVRELSSDSAAMLEDILALTDNQNAVHGVTTVTMDSLLPRLEARSIRDARTPSELVEGESFHEGCQSQILVNRYERDTKARAACIAIHGSSCFVCGFDYAHHYGAEFAGFIHVHHLVPLSEIGEDYQVNPETDLCPICPNCHAIIHRKSPPYEITDVYEMMIDQVRNGEC